VTGVQTCALPISARSGLRIVCGCRRFGRNAIRRYARRVSRAASGGRKDTETALLDRSAPIGVHRSPSFWRCPDQRLRQASGSVGERLDRVKEFGGLWCSAGVSRCYRGRWLPHGDRERSARQPGYVYNHPAHRSPSAVTGGAMSLPSGRRLRHLTLRPAVQACRSPPELGRCLTKKARRTVPTAPPPRWTNQRRRR